MRTNRIGALAVAIAALALAACGSDTETQASAEQNLCSSLATFSSAVTGLQGLNPQSTKADWEEQTQAVQNSWEGVQNAAEGVQQADTAALESAHDNLQSSIDDLSDDTTFAEGAKQIQPQLSELSQAWKQTWDGLDCAATTSTTDS